MAVAQIVVISGAAGCGKSVAAKALEDCGFFVIDNFPPQLFTKMIDLADSASESITKIGFVIDAREQQFLAEFPENWQLMFGAKHSCTLLYLDASDETIVARFKQTRRRHPLDQGNGIKESLARERRILAPLQNLANHRISTDNYSVQRLGREIKQYFSSESNDMQVTLLSFGFKYGVPSDLDLCFDVRFLDNPHFNDKLRPGTGLDKEVADYVFTSEQAPAFVERIVALLEYLVPLYQKEGKSYLTVAIGCTGGRHRAVAVTDRLFQLLSSAGRIKVAQEHRDIGKAN